ncbi:hypothetical protein EDF35_1584 [Rathayibacter sp. PhB151]|uniref:hypothetical protein n=1 Tax=Rathayibacter sp. PhB151 TaxID=2485189 RepID=UPI0010645E6E|nr:hypothetical protein [Rathayibacter sp. PhB151]TDX78383.1 hypothetical protein EDF35_1584 [Rathayibacter sp. PhB151]
MSFSSDGHALTVRRAAEEAGVELRRHDEDAALRIVTQAFGGLRPQCAGEELEDFLLAPRSTGDLRFDVLIAVLARRTSRQRGLRIPDWTDVRALEEEWMPGTTGTPIPQWRDIVRRETPQDFLEKNILAREKSWSIR